MLDSMRKASSGWIAKILMGLLVISFAVWGVNDVFQGYSSTSVATVGDTEISAVDFQRAVDDSIRQYSQRLNQPLTRAQAHQYGLDSAALSQLIGLAAFDTGAKQSGLTVGDTVVAQNITSDPSLAGTFGKFDRDGFDQQLQRMGTTEKAFIEDRRKYLVRMQLNSAIEAGVEAPDTMINAISTYQGETRTAAYIILPPQAVGTIGEPDKKTIEAYYTKAAIHFTTPELRDFSVMVLNPDDLTANITISDEDLEVAYASRRAAYDVPERRIVQQIPFATEDAAKAADVRLKAGTPVATIVGELGLEMSDIELGNVSSTEMISKEVADAAFALKPDSYSDPIKGPLGTVILHVGAVTPSVPSTFEDVKEKLRATLASEKAHSDVYDVQNEIEDARAGGMSLQEATAKYHLKLTTFKGISAVGKTLDGKVPDNLPQYKDLLKIVFENGQGDQIPPGDTGTSGYYWVAIDNVTPATLQPLADVQDKVVALWKNEERKSKLQEMAQNLTERGNKGESIDKLAASIGRSALTSPSIKRASQNETFSRLAVSRLFALPKGGFTDGPVGFGDSMIVMQVKSIDVPKIDIESDDYKSTQEALTEALSNDILVTMVLGYESKLGTKVNTKLLDQLTMDGTQQ